MQNAFYLASSQLSPSDIGAIVLTCVIFGVLAFLVREAIS